MIDKLDEVERRYDRLEADLANPETLGDSARLTKVMKERSSLERIVGVYRAFKSVRANLGEAEQMLESSDPDERALGKEELPALRERRDALEAELKVLLIPRDPNDEKNVILEIRAGAGGDEAGLFGDARTSFPWARSCTRWRDGAKGVSSEHAGGYARRDSATTSPSPSKAPASSAPLPLRWIWIAASPRSPESGTPRPWRPCPRPEVDPRHVHSSSSSSSDSGLTIPAVQESVGAECRRTAGRGGARPGGGGVLPCGPPVPTARDPRHLSTRRLTFAAAQSTTRACSDGETIVYSAAWER